MNEFQTYEYTVHPKTEGKLLLKKILLISLYTAFILGAFALVVSFTIFVPLFAVVPLMTFALVSLTWKYVNVDFEISVTSGVITLSNIYGNKKRKQVFEATISKMTVIAPYTEKHFARYARNMPSTQFDALSSQNCENKYFAIFQINDNESALFIFEYNEKLLKICKFYNSPATIIEKADI